MKKIYLSLLAFIFALQLSAQTNDVGIVKIIEPDTFMCASKLNKVKVRIKNFGTQTETSFPVNYQRGVNIPVTEIFNGLLLAGDSVDFTFLTEVPCPIGTSTAMCYWTKLANDNNLHNDTMCKSIIIFPNFYPYIIDTVSNNHTLNIPANTTVNYHAQLGSFFFTSFSIHWYYQPANDVTIVTNTVGDSATIHFGNNALSGILSVYELSNHCNSDTLLYIVNIGTSGINNIESSLFFLAQNSPNPASANTKIRYYIPTAGIIKFEVLNILGQTVFSKTEKQQAGENSINLNVKDLRDGIYYYAIEYNGKKQFKKMVVSK
ncbi:MAG: T9SS type A sorting domain-containing protein [Bacteroidetes bacterium]|nr:T9SS type A sorting domain-containing protein [Bacteroidota bacterium]